MVSILCERSFSSVQFSSKTQSQIGFWSSFIAHFQYYEADGDSSGLFRWWISIGAVSRWQEDADLRASDGVDKFIAMHNNESLTELINKSLANSKNETRTLLVKRATTCQWLDWAKNDIHNGDLLCTSSANRWSFWIGREHVTVTVHGSGKSAREVQYSGRILVVWKQERELQPSFRSMLDWTTRWWVWLELQFNSVNWLWLHLSFRVWTF